MAVWVYPGPATTDIPTGIVLTPPPSLSLSTYIHIFIYFRGGPGPYSPPQAPSIHFMLIYYRLDKGNNSKYLLSSVFT